MKDKDVEEIVDTVLNQLPRYCLTKNDGEWGLKRIEQGAYADISDLDEILREALKQAEARGAERNQRLVDHLFNKHHCNCDLTLLTDNNSKNDN